MLSAAIQGLGLSPSLQTRPESSSTTRKAAAQHGKQQQNTDHPRTAGTVLLGASGEALTALAAADGQPAYRGKQLADGVRNGARSLEEINNVRPLRL